VSCTCHRSRRGVEEAVLDHALERVDGPLSRSTPTTFGVPISTIGFLLPGSFSRATRLSRAGSAPSSSPGDAGFVEDRLEKLRPAGLVARRAGGVEAHDARSVVDGLLWRRQVGARPRGRKTVRASGRRRRRDGYHRWRRGASAWSFGTVQAITIT